MPMSGSLLARDIELLSGFAGESTRGLMDAIGNSFIDHLKTGIVSTTDVGVIPGAGNGIGTVVGLTPPVFQGLLVNNLSGFSGSSLTSLITAISNATVKHISTMALVKTSHAPTFAGNGTGQISGLNDSILSKMIRSSAGFKGGEDWPYFCEGVAKSFVNFIQTNAIVNVVITGAPTGTVTPGGGSGTGRVT